MSIFKRLSRLPKKTKVTLAAVFIVVIVVLGGAVVVRHLYDQALQPVSGSEEVILVEVPSGASVQEIATELKEQGLIRESWAFEWYVRNSTFRDDLKAGTYALRPSQDVPHIVDVLAQGEVATDLVTIVPGERLDQVRVALINSGFKPEAVDAALEPGQYNGHPALVDKPAGASLEGYLYPESFQKTADVTTAKDIVEASLDEMQKRLTPTVRAGMVNQGLTVYEGIILASIVEQEVAKPADRPVVAQVFLKRLREGIRLESDATAGYGAILAGQPPSLTYDSAYNTYYNAGLPPTPISNMDESALLAVVNPAKTDYNYFVSGDDGNTYFAKTLAEHEQNIEKYCKTLCN